MNGGSTDPIWQTPSASTAGVQLFNFIIYKDGSTYYAKNCTTGTLDYSNTNFRLLLQSINTALLQADGVRVSLGLKNSTYPLDDGWQPGHATFGANQWLEMIGETRDGVVLLNTFVPTVVDDYHVPYRPLQCQSEQPDDGWWRYHWSHRFPYNLPSFRKYPAHNNRGRMPYNKEQHGDIVR